MPTTRWHRGSLVASLLLGGAAWGALSPPSAPRAFPRGLAVSDDQGGRHDLRALVAGEPTLLLPIFARCTGTCPMTAVLLKEALGKVQAPFRVALLSFDGDDAARDLEDFRERFALPARWLVVRSADAIATRDFLGGLGFHFMKSEGGFDHPNETFVFSPRGSWAATFAGAAFSKGELEVAWRRAMAADDESAVQRLRAWLIRPEAWIALACAGLALSATAIVLLARKARTG